MAVPNPKKINSQQVLEPIPFGSKFCKAINGGMQVTDLFLPELGDCDDSIIVAIACVEVKLDIN